MLNLFSDSSQHDRILRSSVNELGSCETLAFNLNLDERGSRRATKILFVEIKFHPKMKVIVIYNFDFIKILKWWEEETLGQNLRRSFILALAKNLVCNGPQCKWWLHALLEGFVFLLMQKRTNALGRINDVQRRTTLNQCGAAQLCSIHI